MNSGMMSNITIKIIEIENLKKFEGTFLEMFIFVIDILE